MRSTKFLLPKLRYVEFSIPEKLFVKNLFFRIFSMLIAKIRLIYIIPEEKKFSRNIAY